MQPTDRTPVRGCGTRVRGGVYAECRLSESGAPLEHFLVDPPIAYEPAHAVGVELVERAGVWHVLDYVGANHYPETADFIEETRHFGVSRRLPANLDFSKLTRESKLILVHRHAGHENDRLLPNAIESLYVDHQPTHVRYTEPDGDEYAGDFERELPYPETAVFYRETKTARYGMRPTVVSETTGNEYPPDYVYFQRDDVATNSAIFMAVPLTHIAVVADGGKERPTVAKITSQVDIEVPVDVVTT